MPLNDTPRGYSWLEPARWNRTMAIRLRYEQLRRHRSRRGSVASHMSNCGAIVRAAARLRATRPRTSVASDASAPAAPTSRRASPGGRRTPCASPRARGRRSRRAPRELKRENSAVVSTGVGTPSSIAAIEVQRPSPESDTRPENSFEVRGLATAPSAVRSSSQEPITRAAPPHLGDVGGVDVVLVVLGMLERRGLGVRVLLALAGVGVAQDVEPLGVGAPSARTRSRCGPSSRSARRRSGRSAGSPARRGSGRRVRPGVRGAASTPGASDANSG